MYFQKLLLFNLFEKILDKYPYVTYSLEGQQKEQAENLSSLSRNYLIAFNHLDFIKISK